MCGEGIFSRILAPARALEYAPFGKVQAGIQAAGTGKTACPVCGTIISSSFEWCPNCGAELRPHPCAYCGQLVKPGETACTFCGAPRIK